MADLRILRVSGLQVMRILYEIVFNAGGGNYTYVSQQQAPKF